MLGWVGDIERATLENETFRTVLFTGAHTRLTVMSLGPGEDIGREAHSDMDQFIRVEEGTARVEFGSTEEQTDEPHEVQDDWAIVIPAGVWHNVVNTGVGDLKLYSLYSPPQRHQALVPAEEIEHLVEFVPGHHPAQPDLLAVFNRHHEGETVRKAQLDVDPLLPEPLQFHKILDNGRPMGGVDDPVSLAEHKDPLTAHRYGSE